MATYEADVVSSGSNTSYPVEKPKRPLSAYNVFFQHERQRILDGIPDKKAGKSRKFHGKISFASLARCVAAKWKSLDQQERAYYNNVAAEDKQRYKLEKEEWEASVARSSKKGATSPKQSSAKKIPSPTSAFNDDSYLTSLKSQFGYHLLDNVKAGTPFKGSGGDLLSAVGFDLLPAPIMSSPVVQSMPDISELADKLDADCKTFLFSLLQ